MMNLRLVQPEVLVDIGCASDLAWISRNDDGVLRIGATTRQSEVARSPEVAAHAPLIPAALRFVSHPAIRNRGTFGGSLAHADPAAELPAVAIALNASLALRGSGSLRVIAADDFFLTHLTTVMEEGEMLVEVRIPAPAAAGAVGDAFVEIARRHGDFALAGVAVRLISGAAGETVHARIALCGVADVPYRARAAEELLVGRSVDDALAAEAGALAVRDLTPLSDTHASGRYRRDVAAVLVARAILSAASRGEGCSR